MIFFRILFAVSFLTVLGCSTPEKARLSILDSGEESKGSGKGYNWDQVKVIGVDGRTITATRKLALKPGRRVITFSVSYIRGDMDEPILAEVPVSCRFDVNRDYQAYAMYKSPGLMGVYIQELDTAPEEYSLRAGSMVYSPEFDAYDKKE